MLLGAGEHGAHQGEEVARHLEQEIPHPEALGGGALVIAAAPRLEPSGDVLAGARGEVALGLGQVGAHLRIPGEVGEPAVEDVEQAREQAGPTLRRHDALFRQHDSMSEIGQRVLARPALEPRQVRNLLVLDQRGAARAQPRMLEERVLAHVPFLPAAATANWKTRFAARIVVCDR